MQIIKTALLSAALSLATSWAPSFGVTNDVPDPIEETKLLYKRPHYTVFEDDQSYKPQIATLGKMLFFDTRLSKAENMSCATCHNPSFGWEAPVAKSIGALNKQLPRHAPTIVNLGEARHFNWDGSKTTLEEQAEGPITNPEIMGNNFEGLVKRLSEIKSYKKWFDMYFPGQGLTKETILTSIATFERVLQSGPTPFDRWVEGDKNAISLTAQKGFDLFNYKFGCANCHSGWNFTDHSLHNMGHPVEDLSAAKQNSYESSTMRSFRTPGLREIASRAPYMHNGAVKTLEDVVDFYLAGGATQMSRSVLIKPFDTTPLEKQALVAFLKTLTSEERKVQSPLLPAD